MRWTSEAARAMAGTWRLILHDKGGLEHFNLTAQGFWRSFSAVVVIAPFYILATSGDSGADAKEVSPFMAGLTLVLQWIFWPAIMALIAPVAGFSKNYARYITVFNWSEIPLAGMVMIPALLLHFQLADVRTAGIFSLNMLLVSRYLRWYITRVTLETDGVTAAALVLFDFVSGLAIARLTGIL